jgi:hypothetical protein
MERSRTLLLVATGLAALALCATVAGHLLAWEVTQGDAGGFGRVYVGYHLRGTQVTVGGIENVQSYDARDSEASAGLMQTFSIQSLITWTATILSLAAVGLVLAWLFATVAWARPATLGALGLLVLVSIAGTALFANNFPNTEEGEQDGSRTFWGSKGGFTWGPGPAWYAEAGAGVAALAAVVAAVLSIRGGSAASASTGPL